MSQENNVKAVKSGIWYTVSNFLVKSIGFITIPIFTRMLSKAEFGQYNNFTAWLSLFQSFITLNLGATLISARYDFEKEFDSYILSILAFVSFSGLVWVVIYFLFPGYAESILALDARYFVILVVYVIFYLCIDLYQVRERYYYEYKITVALSVLLSVLTALLSVLFVYTFSDRLLGRILGQVLPVLLLGTCCLFFFLKKGREVHFKYLKYAFPIALPYVLHGLSMTVLNSMDRVMITQFCGAESTAIYSLAYTCGTIITLLAMSINTAYSPWMAEQLNDNNFVAIRKVSKKYILFFMYISMGIMLISPEILYILGGKEYVDAVYVLAPVSMGCVCQYVYTMFVNVEQFKKKTVGMAFGSVSAAVLNFVLNLVFIPMFGYLAAAYTTLAGYAFLLIVHMLIVKKIGFAKVYDYNFTAIAIIAGTVIMLGIVALYANSILRYAIVIIYSVVLCLFIIRNKAMLLSFIKSK